MWGYVSWGTGLGGSSTPILWKKAAKLPQRPLPPPKVSDYVYFVRYYNLFILLSVRA